MPAAIEPVNLLEQGDLSESPVSKVISWASTYGRYIMITTEVVVLLAFISRFSLDRKLTDLNESIDQKRIIIEANKPFEEEYLATYNKLSELDAILKKQTVALDTLINIKQILPTDVYLESLSLNLDSISFDVIAGTVEGFASFINSTQKLPNISDVEVGDIKKDPVQGIVFDMKITRKKQAPKKIQNTKTGQETETSAKETDL